MSDQPLQEDPEPCEHAPAGPLFVPVRPGAAGAAVRLFRTPLGTRTAVGFTSVRRLAAALGPRQEWARISEPALRALVAPLGAVCLTVDPRFTAPAPSPAVALRAAAAHSADAVAAGLGLRTA